MWESVHQWVQQSDSTHSKGQREEGREDTGDKRRSLNLEGKKDMLFLGYMIFQGEE
jgi:hypothetical protein